MLKDLDQGGGGKLPAAARGGWHHSRLDSLLLAALLFVVASGSLFALIASRVIRGGPDFDARILEVLRDPSDPSRPLGPDWLHLAMIDITGLGGGTMLTLFTLLCFGYLLVLRRRATAIFLAASVIGGALLSTGLKLAFLRPRPDLVPHLVDVATASFPSGHAMNSAVVFLTLGALLARAEASRRVRVYLVSVAIGLTVLVGVSRIYLGVHWPTDVLAGWCVGAAWSSLCSVLALVLQRSRQMEPPAGG